MWIAPLEVQNDMRTYRRTIFMLKRNTQTGRASPVYRNTTHEPLELRGCYLDLSWAGLGAKGERGVQLC